MPITIKSSREIELMTEAGRILEQVHIEMEKALKPGMSTWDIDKLGEEVIRSYGCIPSFLGYNGYPASICVSVNFITWEARCAFSFRTPYKARILSQRRKPRRIQSPLQ